MSIINKTVFAANAAYSEIATGGYHSLVLMSDGTLIGWGYNGYGQLGIETPNTLYTPTIIPGLIEVKQVATGFYHSAVLMNDGTVKTFGENDHGQLGLGTIDNNHHSTPTAIQGLTGVSQIFANDNGMTTFAIMNDGTVKAWGYNNAGQLGIGNTTDQSSPVTISGLIGVKQIGTGYNFTIALMNDGTVKAWGGINGKNVPTVISGLTSVKQIAAGYGHVVALMNDGTVKTWGWNYWGQLGMESSTGIPTVVSGLTGVKQVTAGGGHTAVLLNNGTVKAFGENQCGQLGTGDKDLNVHSTPTTVPGLTDVKQITTGGDFTIALMNDETLMGWGLNSSGQLGLGKSTTWETTPRLPYDVTPPTAAITYNPAGPYIKGDVVTITATFSETMNITPAPKISISGVTSLSATDMTRVDAIHYTYSYTVGIGKGIATVSLSTGKDLGDNVVTSTPTSGGTFTIDSSLPSVTTAPVISDVSDNGDGSDLKVTFKGVADETNVSGYRIIVVPSKDISTFNINTANTLTSGKYISEAKNGNNGSHIVTLSSTAKDINGAFIGNNETYCVIVMSVGGNGYSNSISKQSNYLTLTTDLLNTINSITKTSAGFGNNNFVKDSQGNYYVTYNSNYNGKTHIFVKKSSDGGITWKHWTGSSFAITGAEKPIETSNYYQESPSIAVDSSNSIHVVWVGTSTQSPTNIQIRYSKYNGTSWSTPINLTNSTTPRLEFPNMVIDNSDNIHIVWQEWNEAWVNQIRYIKYNGTSWSSITDITNGDYDESEPSIAIDSNDNIHLVWFGYNELYIPQIKYSKYTTSWSTPIEIASSDYEQYSPSIAIDSSDNIHVTWYGYNESYIIQIKYSKYTTSWSVPIDITNANYDQYNSSIAIDSSNNIYVAWIGNNESNVYQIRYSKYTTSWSSPVNLTTGDYIQMSPKMLKGAGSFIWLGSTDEDGISNSGNGIMLYKFNQPIVLAPVAMDIANTDSAQDMQVTFAAGTNETNVTSYRVYVVPTENVATFNQTAANTNTYYQTETKKSAKVHSFKLNKKTKDTAGAEIKNGKTYKVYVNTIFKNPELNTLSNGSTDITLTGPVADVKIPTANDIANNGNGSDIGVSFKGLLDESNISGYKIFVAPSAVAFKVENAIGASSSYGYVVAKLGNGKTYNETLQANQKTTANVLITNGVAYKVYVLAIGSNGYGSSLSNPSQIIKLSAAVPKLETATSVQAVQKTHAGNASDIKGTFTAPDETNIASYQVYIVKAANAVTFAGTAIATITNNANHEDVVTTGKGKLHTVIFDVARLDSDGNAIVKGIAYKVFILSVGKNNYTNQLSNASNNVTLN